ncbi:MAG: hypothetical protein M1378_04510 [Bacteroidetes bacterium]|nr:hypothetical protein [Bacteroidota bacterium]
MNDIEAIEFLIAKGHGFDSQLMQLVKTEYSANRKNRKEPLKKNDYMVIGQIYWTCFMIIALDTHSRVEAASIAKELFPDLSAENWSRIGQTRYIEPGSENPENQSLNVCKAQEMVHDILAAFNVVEKIEKADAETVMCLLRGLRDGKIRDSSSVVQELVNSLPHSKAEKEKLVQENPGQNFLHEVRQAMIEQAREALKHPINKSLKVTQRNIAKRLSCARTTFESKLKSNLLDWKNLKKEIDEEVRQIS